MDWPLYLNRELLLIAVLVQIASALAIAYLLVLLLTRLRPMRLLGQVAVLGLHLLPGGASFAAANSVGFRLLIEVTFCSSPEDDGTQTIDLLRLLCGL